MDSLIGFFRALLISFGLIRKPEFVVRLIADHPNPAGMETGVIYVVGGAGYTKWAYLRCPTGNGDVIQLSLQPKHRPRWDVAKDWLGRATVHPSVRQMEGSYAHFWIKKGAVLWCEDTGRPPAFRQNHWQA
jgi:hypothetical protein